MAPTNKRTERARENHTFQFLSRKPFLVTRQTPRRPDVSYSLKPANFAFRCPHTRQGLKALLGAPRRLSQLISATYRSQPQKPAKNNPYPDFLHNRPPSIDSASLASLVTIIHNRSPINFPVLRSGKACIAGYYGSPIDNKVYRRILRFGGRERGVSVDTTVLRSEIGCILGYYGSPIGKGENNENHSYCE